MSNLTLDERCSIFATGNYTHDFPVNWTELDDDEQYQFIETHHWQPFENWPTDDVVTEIVNLQDKAEYLLKDILNLKTLDNPVEPYYLVKIAVRHGEYEEKVTSLRQATDESTAIKMAFEGASRGKLFWETINDKQVAFDCHRLIFISFIDIKPIKPEHIGILELYVK